MSDTESSPNSSQVTDEDLIIAVKEQCERAGVPVVPTSEVAEADRINVTNQTVKRRLEDIDSVNSMKVGRGHVWWVPDDEEEVRGEVDMSSVYLDNLEPEDLPTELIEKHPEGPATEWEKWQAKGASVANISALALITGFATFGLNSLSIVEFEPLRFIGATLIVAGFVNMFVGFTLQGSAHILEWYDAPQPKKFLWTKTEPLRNWLAEKISGE